MLEFLSCELDYLIHSVPIWCIGFFPLVVFACPIRPKWSKPERQIGSQFEVLFMILSLIIELGNAVLDF